MAVRPRIDRLFLFSTAALAICGFIIFLSASLGLLAGSNANFSTIALKQGASLLMGGAAFFIFSRIKYTLWRKFAWIILAGAIAINLVLFIPQLTLHYNGASRWINVGPLSFQPSEFLKIAFIVYLGAWVYMAKDRIKLMKFGLFPYMILMGILGTLLLIQSDTDTLVIIGVTGLVMLLIAGLPIRHLLLCGLLIGVVVASVITFRPYARQRFMVFLHPSSNTLGAGYQINQSLIAIGSGGMFGRGFGQSIQKFGYLPQPTDDSIFAVAAEEFGFVGTSVLLGLYCLFAAACLRVATRCTDLFGGMVASGIAMLVIAESFLNIAAMLGLIPISGVPLLFVSHGGTALVIILMGAGIVANISKYQGSRAA
jgi:cell division protein FtsW